MGAQSDRTLGLLRVCVQALERPWEPFPTAQYSGSQRRWLLDLLRRLFSKLVQLWSGADAASNAEILPTLQQFERVDQSIRDSLEADTRHPAGSSAADAGTELAMELAHDLRSPITSILFLSETLRNGHMGEVNEAQRRQLGIMYSAALHLVSLANDVIEWARGGDQIDEHQLSPFSIREMLLSIRELIGPMAEERGLAVHILLPERERRLGFPVPLSRALLNLTTNALKYTDTGFVEISVQDVGEERLEFSVRDTGRGIPTFEIPHLFEPFRRGSPGQRFDLSSSGLGLAICQKLVKAMGSELHVETAPGLGTRFWFELNMAPADP